MPRFLLALLATVALAPMATRAAPEELDLARFHGHVVILDFWASWCKPCRQSIPWLNEMRSRYASQGLTIIGVNVDAKQPDAEKFLRDTPIEFQVFFDPQGELARRYDLKGMPSTFVFDRDGKLVATHLGFQAARTGAREAELRKLLEKERQ